MKSTPSQAYWKANLKLVSILLTIWFAVAFGGGIFLISWLNQFSVGRLGLGFWIAQQGSIFAFIGLVLIYALCMDRLDRKFESGE